MFFWSGRPKGLARLGFAAAVLGILLVLAGDYGVFYTEIDDRFLMSAPAYRALRFGFFLMAAGTALFAYGALRAGSLPRWVALVFLVGSVLGFVSFVRDLSYVGGGLWISYGVAWVLLGLTPPVEAVRRYLQRRRKKRAGTTGARRQNADQPL